MRAAEAHTLTPHQQFHRSVFEQLLRDVENQGLGGVRFPERTRARVRRVLDGGVDPFPNRTAYYDSMRIDDNKFLPSQRARGGIAGCDAIFDPMFSEAQANFRGWVDSLYAYGAAGPLEQQRSSSWHNKLCAVRFYDPDPVPIHGRTQWFGFPLYYFLDDDVQETFNRSVDWFRDESVPGP